MKFLVDAHLPPSLSRLLTAFGHDSVHTQDLPERNLTPDRALNDLSVQEQRVLISTWKRQFIEPQMSPIPQMEEQK